MSTILFFTALFFLFPIVFEVLIPLFVSIFIAKRIFGKKISFKAFIPFVVLILGFLVFGNIAWNLFVFNKIYYEWDRIFFPLTLLSHEAPALDGMATWITHGWSLLQLDFLYYGFLFTIYVPSVLLSFWWIKKKQKHIDSKTYLKTQALTVVLLLVFAITSPFIISRLQSAIGNFFYKPIKRIENSTACTKPNKEKERIYFGGNGADFIASKDGKTMKKIWQRNGGGLPIGLPSPDGSAIAYPESDGMWIKCTETSGLYFIPFEQKIVGGINTSVSDTSISWSPDDKFLVLNFAGDVIQVDVFKKKKKILYPQIAVKDFGIDPTKPRPSGFSAYFQAGHVYWAQDNSIYYEKYTKDTVEFRKLESGKDELVFEGKYPLAFGAFNSDSSLLLVSEYDWGNPRPDTTSPHFDTYIFNTVTKEKQYEMFGKKLNSNDYGGLSSQFEYSPDGKFMIVYDGGLGAVDNNNTIEFKVVNLQTQEETNVKQKVKAYLLQKGLSKVGDIVTIESKGWSRSNDILIYVFFEDGQKSPLTLTSDAKGENIQVIFKDSDRKNINSDEKSYLMPASWI